MRKKFMSRIFSMFLIISVFFSINVYAKSGESQHTQYQNAAKIFLENRGINAELSDPIDLYNFDDSIEGVLFTIDKTGYIIVSKNDYEITEFSLISKNKFINDSKKKYYYNGPLAYFQEENGNIINSKTKENLGKLSDIKNKKNVISTRTEVSTYLTATKTKDSKASNVNMSSTSTTHDYFIGGTLPNYSYNPNGICGSTAGAMFARYYNDYLNGSYVPDDLVTDDGIALIKHLVPFIDGSVPGSTPEELRAGFEKYLVEQGVSDTMKKATINLSDVSTIVRDGCPFMVDLNTYTGNKYGEHWVTAYGYNTTDILGGLVEKLSYVVVNDGWGSTGVYININWIGYIVW